MMTTSGEHEPRVIGWANYDELREAVAVARRERDRPGSSRSRRHGGAMLKAVGEARRRTV